MSILPITVKRREDVVSPNPCTFLAHAVQGDAYTRAIECELYHDGTPWNDGDGASVYVFYEWPDGQTGEYNLLPNGEVAGSVTGNKLQVLLSPGETSVSGLVRIWVSLHKDGHRITLPEMHLAVEKNPTEPDHLYSVPYTNLDGLCCYNVGGVTLSDLSPEERAAIAAEIAEQIQAAMDESEAATEETTET